MPWTGGVALVLVLSLARMSRRWSVSRQAGGDISFIPIPPSRVTQLVEVLSPGTETKDRVTKFRAYQEQETVQEIVLVNQFAQYVEIWQHNEHDPLNPKAWHYRHYGLGESIDLLSIHVRIEITTVYRGIDFDDEEPEEDPT